MNLLYKVAESKKKKENYIDPYILAGTGLAGAGVYHTAKAYNGHTIHELLKEMPEAEREAVSNLGKILSDKKLLNSLSKEELKEFNNAKKDYNHIVETLKYGDPAKYRNIHGLMAAGLTAGALGTMLYGAHKAKKDNKKYNKMTSATIPGLGMGIGITGLFTNGAIKTITQRNPDAYHKSVLMTLPISVSSIGYQRLINQRDRKNQYTH